MTTTLALLKTNGLTFSLWLVANLLSFSLVGAMFHNFPLAFAFPPNVSRLGSFRPEAAIVGFFFGFIPALLIGFLQHLILRRHFPLSRWWIISASASDRAFSKSSDSQSLLWRGSGLHPRWTA
jgi:hypothetical protein